ncbi:efflux RND transporter periplasmic adaptor subunit [Chitinophaga japonensis]|uniref:Cobalt-zinc-cadmium efflux system membrane fusion protein n=1 Tax=Chitinophaga japonensis TaxID=104662 RepID=A0A562SPE7_CHIJA|nr:efflux RND transporter periplasmic adaptor subunit [Chitinophaga japonensis]TWI82550.1 cobalt-zinc-cadmium efflux system membrane fusion protein [Chitinophaga japonensis]
MTKQYISLFAGILAAVTMAACNNREQSTHAGKQEDQHTAPAQDSSGTGMREVHLSGAQFKRLGIRVDTLPQRRMSGIVEANGQLEVPPQHEATVTTVLGANVAAINVIEGDKVNKGQVLATVSHPDLTRLQTDYVKAWHRLQFLEKEYDRQQRLYEAEVGSGKNFQQTAADYRAMEGEVRGYEAQLRQLHLDAQKVRAGSIYTYVPVISPIDGYIEKVLVQVGQYMQPQTPMFLVVNTDHIHADLMVFEKDAHKVRKGQTITFTVASAPGSELSATIYSVGKLFEQNPKTVHVHAEIDNKKDMLIPGMYINGKIHTSEESVMALPEAAIIEEENRSYIFVARQRQQNGQTEWAFQPVAVRKGMEHEGWVAITPVDPLPAGAQVSWNNAYYLVAEMKKGEAGHGH